MHRWMAGLAIISSLCTLATTARAAEVFRSAVGPGHEGVSHTARLGQSYLRLVLDKSTVSISKAALAEPRNPALHSPVLSIKVWVGDRPMEVACPGDWVADGDFYRFAEKLEKDQKPAIFDNALLTPNLCLAKWNVTTSISLVDYYEKAKKRNFLDRFFDLVQIGLPIFNNVRTALQALNISVSPRISDGLDASVKVWDGIRNAKPPQVQQATLFESRPFTWLSKNCEQDEASVPRYVVVGAQAAGLTQDFTDEAQAVQYVTDHKDSPSFLLAYELKDTVLSSGIVEDSDADPTLRRSLRSVAKAARGTEAVDDLRKLWTSAEAVVEAKIDDNEYISNEWGFLHRVFARLVSEAVSDEPAASSEQAKVLLRQVWPKESERQLASYLDNSRDQIASLDWTLPQNLTGVMAAAWSQTHSVAALGAKAAGGGGQGEVAKLDIGDIMLPVRLETMDATELIQKVEPLAVGTEVLYWLEVGQVPDRLRLMKFQPDAAQALAAAIAQQHGRQLQTRDDSLAVIEAAVAAHRRDEQ